MPYSMSWSLTLALEVERVSIPSEAGTSRSSPSTWMRGSRFGDVRPWTLIGVTANDVENSRGSAMVDREVVRTGGFQSPEPQQQTWPAPAQPARPERSSSARGREGWWSAAALLAGIIGVVGALLPAMDGQKIGDPDSVAFRLGVPLGVFGGLVAVVIGALVISRSPTSAFSRGVAIASLVVGSVALFMTAALAFSG